MRFQLKGHYFDGSFQTISFNKFETPTHCLSKKAPFNDAETLWEISLSSLQIDDCIDSAYRGFQVWKETPLQIRIEKLTRFAEIASQRKKEWAEAISWETGKPLWESETEVQGVISKVAVTIKNSLPLIQNQFIENILPETHGSVTYKALGPSLIIGPFNFPMHLANGQILACLLAGNSIIFKPSEKTFYTGQLLIEALHDVGFPPGVVNLFLGEGEASKRLVKDKRLKGIFFTGSKDVGLSILSQTYNQLHKLVALELGGKNVTIIHKDASLPLAVSETLKSAYLTTGQRCTSTGLIFIHSSLENSFTQIFHDMAKKIIVDHPFLHAQTPFMGPLIDEKSQELYLTYCAMAKRNGFEEIMRGKHLERPFSGYYVSPSVYRATASSSILSSHYFHSEVFGPTVGILPYDSLEEAIEWANTLEYGLASSFFGTQETDYMYCVNNLEVGLLNWNRSTVGASAQLPFGGVKNSGNYRPAALSTITSCVYPLSSLRKRKIDVFDDKNSKNLNHQFDPIQNFEVNPGVRGLTTS